MVITHVGVNYVIIIQCVFVIIFNSVFYSTFNFLKWHLRIEVRVSCN